MIDIHYHMLPGLDDGPKDFEQAIALLKALSDDGVEHVIVTPHVYKGHFDNDSAGIAAAFDAFSAQVPPTLVTVLGHWAAEVRLDEHVLPLLRSGKLPLLSGEGGYRTVLLEFPDTLIPVGTEKLIEYLLTQDIHPVIAHPERNKAVRENPSKAKALVDLGCAMQLTAGALLGDFGLAVSRSAHQLVDDGLVHAVASDAHNLNGRRPRMGAARDYIRQRWGQAVAHELTYSGPAWLCGMV